MYILAADIADYLCIGEEDDTWRYYIISTRDHTESTENLAMKKKKGYK